MQEIENDLLLRVARGEKTERTPVWLMRQAGRTLKEYRDVRAKAGSFKNLVTNPEMAAEVTIQPVDILGVDAAIIFSDILVIPEAMGLDYELIEKKGPYFPKTIRSSSDVERMRTYASGDLDYVTEAIQLVKRELGGRVPLIGFAGAPWTIFCYMVEGGGSKTFNTARKMLYQQPELAHRLLDKITESTINYLKDQIAAGADIVQVFDSWAGILPPQQFTQFSLRYIRKITAALKGSVPRIVFAKGAFFARSQFDELDCEVIGLDWNMDIYESREMIRKKVLQGNLDPCVLYGSEKDIESHTQAMLDAFGPYGHIANLGHGVYPDIEPEKIKVFVNSVKNFSVKVPRPYPATRSSD